MHLLNVFLYFYKKKCILNTAAIQKAHHTAESKALFNRFGSVTFNRCQNAHVYCIWKTTSRLFCIHICNVNVSYLYYIYQILPILFLFTYTQTCVWCERELYICEIRKHLHELSRCAVEHHKMAMDTFRDEIQFIPNLC